MFIVVLFLIFCLIYILFFYAVSVVSLCVMLGESFNNLFQHQYHSAVLNLGIDILLLNTGMLTCRTP